MRKILISLFFFLFYIGLVNALSINAPETLEVYAGENFSISVEGNGIFELNVTYPCYSDVDYGTAPMDVMIYVGEDAPSNNQSCEISATYYVTESTSSSSSGSSGGGTVIKYRYIGYPAPSEPIEEIEEQEESTEEVEETIEELKEQKEIPKEEITTPNWLLITIIIFIVLIGLIALIYSLFKK